MRLASYTPASLSSHCLVVLPDVTVVFSSHRCLSALFVHCLPAREERSVGPGVEADDGCECESNSLNAEGVCGE